MSDLFTQQIVDEVLHQMEPIRAQMQARRARGVPLDRSEHAALVGAYVDTMRSRGWFDTVGQRELETVLEILVLCDADGRLELDVESNVTGSVWSVPGWGVSETDPVAVGRGLAEDEADLLDDARDQGELTGWE
jgi:hypothetical protein